MKSLIKRINSVLPNLPAASRKGDNGRIGVIGGSYEFTGAPFYSAMAALKTGADLGHIFCSKASSVSIKAYSPEIIVHPVFISQQEQRIGPEQLPKVIQKWVQKIQNWEKAIHCWVIGPGLGRDPYMHAFFPEAMKHIGRNKVVVFDADGIYYLTQYPQVFKYLKNCKTIITPNHRELSFLQPFLNLDIQNELKLDQSTDEIEQLPVGLRNLHEYTILMKGPEDVILGPRSFIVRTQGGRKRCAGIGDILAGVTSACSLWDFELGPVLASRIVRKSTKIAFERQGRGMTALSVLKEIPHAVKQIENQFPQ